MATILNHELTDLPISRLRRRRSAKWVRYSADVLPAWVAEMDFPLAEPVKLALTEAVELDDCGYASPHDLGLAEAFADFAGSRLGWSVEAARVAPSSDVVGAIRSLLRLLTQPGQTVVINTPIYPPFFTVIEELGCEPAEAPLAAEGLDVEAIERRFAAGAVALLLCSPHNPTGGVATREQLVAIADGAARYGAWVLADEIHAPLVLPGARHVPFLSVSEAASERGIALWSASKAFNIAGLSCAQIVTASDSAAEVVGRLSFGDTHCGHLGAIASIAAFREGGAWLDDVIAVLDHNRQLLAELLAERLPQVAYTQPQASYLVWLDLRALELGDDPSAAILERGGVALSPGPSFGRQGAGFARLNIGTSPALVEEAVERIARVMRRG
ncbi:MAG: aminotransferase class I/II-fold pyridoxal phosphate-dependent enzyme [Solirubrobacteraceae bacterium]